MAGVGHCLICGLVIEGEVVKRLLRCGSGRKQEIPIAFFLFQRYAEEEQTRQ